MRDVSSDLLDQDRAVDARVASEMLHLAHQSAP